MGTGVGTETEVPTTRRVALVLGRCLVTLVLLVVVYFLAPLDPRQDTGPLLLFLLGFAALVAMIVYQLRAIVAARYPGLRAVEAFASAIPLFLLLFAATYAAVSAARPDNFSEPLTRVDALYFTVTVFATVGFGDIIPLSQGGRVLVTIQMVADLLVLGLLVNSILEAVRRGRSRRGAGPDRPAPPGGEAPS